MTSLSVLLGLLVVLVLVVLGAVFASTAVYQLRLRRHCGMPKTTFLEYFKATGVRPEFASAVYDYYKAESVWPHFTISPTDGLRTLFAREEDALEDDLEALLGRLGLNPPSNPVWAGYDRRLETIEDVVYWLGWAAGKQAERV